jgi:hypothetical protein
LLQKHAVAAKLPPNFCRGGQAVASPFLGGEESLDFAGEDTSERLGAARLRKVQQKIVRQQVLLGPVGQGEIPVLGAGPTLGKLRDVVNPIRSKTGVKQYSSPLCFLQVA